MTDRTSPRGAPSPHSTDSKATWSDTVPIVASTFGDLREALGGRTDLPAAELAELACDDQVARWKAGHRIPVEAYLSVSPTLREDADAAFEVIYNEFALRESLGESPQTEEFLWRFPGFADRLLRQVAVHREFSPAGEDTLDDAPETPPTSRTNAETGPNIPGYRILGELGRGGMGVVYKARHEQLNRLVALKVVCAEPSALARFRDEAEAVARFQHAHIIGIYEVGECEGLAYLALEYAAGGSLQAIFAGTPQDPASSAALVEDLARAIHHAHERGIIHRDLKPANIVLTEDGVPKVTDFGLAKLMERDEAATLSGAILGTPSYMAPEQLLGLSGRIAPTVDVYALGAILYDALAGRPPFKGATPMSTLEQVATQEPPPPSRLQRHIPRDLETICLKCLEKEPARRYPSALELAEDLHRFREGRPIRARRASLWEVGWKWARRRPVAAALLASLALALASLIVGSLYYQERLRRALETAGKAERSAQQNARTMQEQRNLALSAFNQMVFEVQEKLGDAPATRGLRQSLLNTAIAGLDRLARSAEGGAPDLARAVAHERLGEINRHVGRSAEARRQFERAEGLAAQLVHFRPDNLAARECMGRARVGLGEIDLAEQEYVRAKARFRGAVNQAEAIVAAAPERPGARRWLFESYLRLGRAHGYAQEFPEADLWLGKARDLAESWAREAPDDPEVAALRSWSHRKLADIRKLSGDAPAARAAYRQAIAIGRASLDRHPDHTPSRNHLAIALHDLAGLLNRPEDLDETERLLREAESHLTYLVGSDAEGRDLRIQLVHAQYDLGMRLKSKDHRAEAQAAFHRVLENLLFLQKTGHLDEQSIFDFLSVDLVRREIEECGPSR